VTPVFIYCLVLAEKYRNILLQVEKENHDTLKWHLSFSDIADVIRRHNAGEKLCVLGVDEFEVEWHLACNLKTLKALYGCKGGANAKFACIYCLKQRERGQWKGGACKCAQHKPPDRDSATNIGKQGPDN
jgi:hypothetical protein